VIIQPLSIDILNLLLMGSPSIGGHLAYSRRGEIRNAQILKSI